MIVSLQDLMDVFFKLISQYCTLLKRKYSSLSFTIMLLNFIEGRLSVFQQAHDFKIQYQAVVSYFFLNC